MLSNNTYSLSEEDLSETFFDFIDKLIKGMYEVGSINSVGQKTILHSKERYDPSIVKHIITKLSKENTLLSENERNYILSFLNSNLLLGCDGIVLQNLYIDGISSADADRRLSTTTIIVKMIQNQITLSSIHKANKNHKILKEIGKILSIDRINSVNKKIGSHNIKFLPMFEQDGIDYALFIYEGKKYLYNLTKNTLVGSLSHAITKSAKVDDIHLFQTSQARLYNTAYISTKAKEYAAKENTYTRETFIDAILDKSVTDIIKKEFLITYLQEVIKKNKNKNYSEHYTISEAIRLNHLEPIIPFIIDSKIDRKTVVWNYVKDGTLIQLGALPFDTILTKLRSTTYKEKPGVQYLAQRDNKYFLIMSNFEEQMELELSEEDFLKLYEDPDSGWDFSY